MIENITDAEINPDTFGRAADYYHNNAVVQKEAAGRLIASLKPWQEILPPGPVLELGCGTGFVSRELAGLFNERPLIFSDRSPKMVNACRRYIEQQENVDFKIVDAEDVPVDEPAYAMTISNFAAQWFRDPPYTLAQWLDVTLPGGLLLAALPGSESFPEWEKHTQDLGIPFTANALPGTEEMVVKLSSDRTQVDYYEDTVTQTFESAAAFFRHLKQIGAGQQMKGRHLSAKEMKMLIDYWDKETDGDITVSWHVVFLAVKKNT
jgi:malonyl-CoA O-methyltransferase